MVDNTNTASGPQKAPMTMASNTNTPPHHQAATLTAATTQNLTLTSLPIEILKEIAGHCPPRALLKLGRTSKHFHAIVDDIVIQNSFLNHMGSPTLKDINKQGLLNALRARLEAEDPTNRKLTWLRFAQVASEQFDSKAVQRSQFIHHLYKRAVGHFNGQRPFSQLVRNSVGTLSTFTILGYPNINGFKATLALMGISRHILALHVGGFLRSDEDRIYGVQSALCFAMETIINWGCLPSSYTIVFRDLYYVGTNEFRNMPDSPNESYLAFHQTISLLTIALMSTALFHGSIRMPRPLAPPFLNVVGRGDQLPLPKPTEVFLHLDESNRIPTSWTRTARALRHFTNSDSWAKWLRNNLNILIEDLNDGEEWIGHSMTVPSEGAVQSQFSNDHFTINSETDGNKINIKADGINDLEGPFSLSGTITRFNCRLTWDTTGRNGKKLVNKGALTPLGICGATYHPLDNSVQGYTWFWKKAWVVEDI